MLIGLHHWALIPDADVANGQGIGGDIRCGEVFRCFKGLFHYSVECVGFSRGFDVVFDVGGFALEFGGIDDEFLHNRTWNTAQPDGSNEKDANTDEERACLAVFDISQEHDGRCDKGYDEEPIDPALNVDIDKSCTEEDVARRIEQAVDFEVIIDG